MTRSASLDLAEIVRAAAFRQEEAICVFQPDGHVGPTPDLSVACAQGPEKKCVPVADPKRPWEYDQTVWDDPAWQTAGFEPEWPHWFHYEFSWKSVPVDDTKEVGVGPGDEPPDVGNQYPCHVVARAYGDLDGDGLYSTYEHSFPSKGDEPLQITNEAE